MQSANIPPEAETIKSLVKISGILKLMLALVIGILNLIWGIIGLLVVIGVIGIIFGIIDIWLYIKCNEIQKLIDQGEIRRAKMKH